MNPSGAFIRRPIATTLIAVGLLLAGVLGYVFLPVASLPAVDFPTIRVNAGRPGADPATMAATVAAPLERRLGEIAGVTELTSSSSLGSTSISIQFDINRKIDNAARDVQAALNAAATDLPSDLPSLPNFRKANPAAAPVLVLAMTSDTLSPSALYDVADTVVAQRISQVEGVAEVTVNGAEQPAIRVRVDPSRLAAMGLSLDAVRSAIVAANSVNPVGSFDGEKQAISLGTNDQLRGIPDYSSVVVRSANGQIVRLTDVATVTQGVRNTRSAGWFNRKPAIVLVITKQPQANVIETVDKVHALLPEMNRWIPAGVDISILSDRTTTIRASIADLQLTLALTIGLVMLVVFVFLRRAAQTIAVGLTVPLSLAGTFAAMWLAGFTLDNLSLMAITVAVGFVVDDAIVVIENVHRNMEAGMDRLGAALEGARQIGFTVISISLSLVAAFIPMIFMDGAIGRMFREFSMTLVFAIAFSTFVSLSVAPMLCSQFMTRDADQPKTRFDLAFERLLGRLTRAYARSLTRVLRHPFIVLAVFVAVVGTTIQLYRTIPKGFFPQDDTGLIFSFTEASPDVSFNAMSTFQQQAAEVVLNDPAVLGVASFIGGSNGGSVNQGRFIVSLKPFGERGITSQEVINRLRGKLSRVSGIRVFMFPVQDLRAGARVGKSPYQFTLWDPDLDELQTWQPRILEKIRALPMLVDVSTDREQGGLQANVVIDRTTAARFGVRVQDIDTALGNAFGQKQISNIYTQRNQYRVVMEVGPENQRDPNDLSKLYVPGAGGTQVPLSAVARIERGTTPLSVNHQGPFPAVTITYDIKPDSNLDAASKAIQQAVAELHLPDTLHADFAGDAKAFAQSGNSQAVLILVAILAVYIILGVLYESLIHPLTIISTLPSAGLGALLALDAAGMDLTLIAFIGIILLIGLVKKNGIMMVDFALAEERDRNKPPVQAIFEASVERFRPILMTTMAALLGAIPLAIATGAGAELRRPLGVTIVGGLILSQILTLYTTPVIYLLMSRFASKRASRRVGAILPLPTPAE
jgi:hydrophobe/amphiphile efflux-1 (HAE1) family protein